MRESEIDGVSVCTPDENLDLAVEGIMKRPEKVAQTLKKILPRNREYAPTCGEPYILFNFYYGTEAEYRYGTPGQSWRTATTQWVTKALINFVFGLRPELEGLRVDPRLPPEWKECSVKKCFRGVNYDIHYHNNGGKKVRISVNGSELDGDILPLAERGTELAVDVYLG